MLLEDQIVGDAKRSDESQSSLEILRIPTSISPPVVHDNHGRAEKDNNNGPIELVN